MFQKHFNVPPKGAVPSQATVRLWVENFRETTSALEKNKSKKKTISRKGTVRIQETVDLLRNLLQVSPRRWTRKRTFNLGIPRTSLLHTLDLNFHPYKILIIQKLKKILSYRKRNGRFTFFFFVLLTKLMWKVFMGHPEFERMSKIETTLLETEDQNCLRIWKYCAIINATVFVCHANLTLSKNWNANKTPDTSVLGTSLVDMMEKYLGAENYVVLWKLQCRLCITWWKFFPNFKSSPYL